MERKIKKSFMYEGLGFPIKLMNVPMIKIRGIWTPEINYNLLRKNALFAICNSPYPITGNELSFIRKYFEMTLMDFGKCFGVTHAAVIKWEKTGGNFAKITPSIEACIRLFVMQKIAKDNELLKYVKRHTLQKFCEFQAHYEEKHITHAPPFSFSSEKLAVSF